MDFVEETFEGVDVTLDGNSYERCRFESVNFIYGGGSLKMTDCHMNHFTWRFTGDLANGLYALHQLFGTEGLITIIRGFTDPKAGTVGFPA